MLRHYKLFWFHPGMGQRAWCGCPTGLHLCDLGAGSRAAGPLAWGPLGPAGVCVHVCTGAWLLLFLVDSSWTGEMALRGGYWPPFSRADWGRPTPRRPRSRGRGQPKLGCAPPVPPGSGDQVGLGSTSFMAGGHTSFCRPWDKCVLCRVYLIGWHRGARAVGEPASRYSATPQLWDGGLWPDFLAFKRSLCDTGGGTGLCSLGSAAGNEAAQGRRGSVDVSHDPDPGKQQRRQRWSTDWGQAAGRRRAARDRAGVG